MKRFVLCLMLQALLLSACSTETVYTVEYSGMMFTVDTEQWTITQGADIYKVQYEQSGSTKDYKIAYPNGAEYWSSETGHGSIGGYDADYDPQRYVAGDVLINVLKKAQPAPRERKGSPLLGAVCIILGAVMFFFPDLLWQFKYGWAYKNAEPSRLALGAGMVSGVVIAVLGVVLFFI